MLLLAQLQASSPVVMPQPPVALVTTLDGVTTVLTAFLFVCLVLPSMVKSRPQYYVAMACLLGVIVLHTLQLVFGTSASFAIGLGVGTGVLQLIAFLLLVLSVGGLTAKELAGDMAKAYEVIRRGETTKEVIIPIGGQLGGRRGGAGGAGFEADAPGRIEPPPPGPDDVDENGIPLP